MKALLYCFILIGFSPLINAEVEPNGFLVFEIDRYTYESGGIEKSHIKQAFKIPLTEEFMSNFKNVPSQNSMGTGFWCSGGNVKNDNGGTRFMWWIHQTADHRWSINMWGKGFETVKGVKVNSWNPSASQYLTIKKWEDLDMAYMLSYVNKYDGLNVSFKVKYMTAKDIQTGGPIPAAPVKKADRSDLFKGDDISNSSLQMSCGFLEG